MNKKLEKLSAIKSIAGQVLEKRFPADNKGKSIAGSILKCTGHKGTPSPVIIDTAKLITASKNSRKLYSEKVIVLAEYIVKTQH